MQTKYLNSNSLCVSAINILMFVALFVFFLFASAEAGTKIVAVQSSRIKPYEDAFNGFKSVCHTSIKRLYISDLKEKNVIKKISTIRPDIILAIGMDALLEVKSMKTPPVLYFMVLNPQSIVSGEDRIAGVSMSISPQEQLLALAMTFPEIKKIGVVYDPEKAGNNAKVMHDAASKLKLKLIVREIKNPHAFPASFMSIKSKIDIFWMQPDITSVTPENIEFLFSRKHRLPVIAFSDKYIERGAIMSIGIDAFDIGVQAGEMARLILSGKDVGNIHQVDARKAVLSINMKAVRALGIAVNGKAVILQPTPNNI